MGETIREMVVRLSMDAGGFKKAKSEISGQIRNLDGELRALGGNATLGQRKNLLEEKYGLQKSAIENLSGAVKDAEDRLKGAADEAERLAAAKNLSSLESELEKVRAKAEATKKQLKEIDGEKFTKLGGQLQTLGKSIQNTGRKVSLYIGGPLLALGAGSYKAFTQFESAFAGVRKTVDATEEEFDELREGILAMSETMPSSASELAGIMEIGGQLGVPVAGLLEFTKTMAMMKDATNVEGEAGSAALARFMKITKSSVDETEQLGSVVTDLGNHFATTEMEILDMSLRMGPTATLAGMAAHQVLGLSAATSEMGMQAQAGGSSMAKLIKTMNLAVDTGGKLGDEYAEGFLETAEMFREMAYEAQAEGSPMAEQYFGWAEEYTKYATLAAYELKKDIESATAGWRDWAIDTGLTKEDAKGLVDSAILLEQFAYVLGMTKEEVEQAWEEDPAQLIINFFEGLKRLDESGLESVLSMLDQMGIVEVRMSNLTAAGAANAERYQEALDMARQAYEEGAALMEEAQKRYMTVESQDAMRMNKLENNMADLGENIVEALEPIKKAIDGLLEGFKGLSEQDQQTIVNLMGALIITGPALITLGQTASAVGSLVKGYGWMKTHGAGVIDKLKGIAGSGLFQAVAAGAAIYLLIDFLSNLPSEAEKIISSLSDIEITINQESKDKTLAAIAEVREAADALSPEKSTVLEGTSAAVAAGYGTESMFGQAVEFERTKAEKALSDLAATMGKKIAEQNRLIGEAAKLGTEEGDELAAALASARDQEQAKWDQRAEEILAGYTATIGGLFDGMMKDAPEAKEALERAVQEYNLMAMMDAFLRSTEDMGEEEIEAFMADAKARAEKLGYEFSGENAPVAMAIYDTVLAGLRDSLKFAAEDTLAYTLLSSLFDADGVVDLMDFRKLEGSVAGAVMTLDFKGAAEKSDKNLSEFGNYLTLGLAEGVRATTGVVNDSMYEVRNQAMDTLRTAFEMHSPSQVMHAAGLEVAQGLADGIAAGTPVVADAIARLGNVVTAIARVKGAEAGRAYGEQFTRAVEARFQIAVSEIQRELINLNSRILSGYGKVGR